MRRHERDEDDVEYSRRHVFANEGKNSRLSNVNLICASALYSVPQATASYVLFV